MTNRELLEILQNAEITIYEIEPETDEARWKAITQVQEAIDEITRRLAA
jgi:hypothetical protein